jgi:antibiotic biosynthesis monooxygenase (ABM) superfamily enzyme
MAIVLFTVRATISAEREAAYNDWYHKEHCPQLLRFPGAVSARRYKTILSDDEYQYMAVYEFENEETFERFQASDHFKELLAEYDAKFGDVSTRERAAHVQVWP